MGVQPWHWSGSLGKGGSTADGRGPAGPSIPRVNPPGSLQSGAWSRRLPSVLSGREARAPRSAETEARDGAPAGRCAPARRPPCSVTRPGACRGDRPGAGSGSGNGRGGAPAAGGGARALSPCLRSGPRRPRHVRRGQQRSGSARSYSDPGGGREDAFDGAEAVVGAPGSADPREPDRGVRGADPAV